MLQIIREVKETLQEFVEHDDKSVMLIEASLEESPLLLKTFAMIEEDEKSPDIFLSFGDEFVETRRFVELIIDRQKEQIEVVNTELTKKDEAKIAELPDNILKRENLSDARLKSLFSHIRETVGPERRVVWLFYPLQDVTQEEEYSNLLGEMAAGVLKEDFGDTKIIIRDTPSKLLAKRFKENEKVWYFDPDLDMQSIFKKMEEQAKDENIPKEERVQNVMLLAGVDVAEKRYDKALAKNQEILKYYRKEKQRDRESIVINNIGDIYYLQGKFPDAQANYEKAILISVDVESQPLVMYQSINLGNSLFMQQKYDESLIYYESAEKLADANKVIPHQVQALERIAEVKRAQEKLDEAIEVLRKAADICRQNKYEYGLMVVLRKLVTVYEEKGDEKNRRDTEKELEACTKKIEEIDPHLIKTAEA